MAENVYLVNRHGILHIMPPGSPTPEGDRLAERWEIDIYLATGEQNTAVMEKPKDAKPKGKT